MIKTPIYRGILQSDLELNGFSAGAGGGGGGGFRFDVTSYGATGNGVSDDTVAIQAALAAIPSTGGLLYFPAGKYKYTGATLALNKPVAVQGDGGGAGGITEGGVNSGTLTPAISMIDFNSPTVSLFTVTSDSCAFKDIQFNNSSATTPSAGAAILVSSGGDKTNYENLTINGFYIGIDVQSGEFSQWHNCFINHVILYGIRRAAPALPDGGDDCISNCYFGQGSAAAAGLRLESASGMKVINTKFIGLYANSLDLAVANSAHCVDLLIANCSFEAYTGAAIKGRTGVDGHWGRIIITANQIWPYPNDAYGIDFNDVNAGALSKIIITGNWADTASSIHAMIELTNTANVAISGNAQVGFAKVLSVGTGVTFMSAPGCVPAGGTTGQVLKKLSNTDYDVGWV